MLKSVDNFMRELPKKDCIFQKYIIKLFQDRRTIVGPKERRIAIKF